MRPDPAQESSSPASKSRCSLERSRRITSSKIFEEVLRRGRCAAGRLMIMRVLPSTEGISRLGVIAAKRTLPRAVDRSRAKRLLREAYRLHRYELAEGYNMVLVARRTLVNARRVDAEAELLHLARRLAIWPRVTAGKSFHDR